MTGSFTSRRTVELFPWKEVSPHPDTVALSPLNLEWFPGLGRQAGV